MNWKLTVAYDGTDFHGWQIQPGFRTIQGELAGAIERVTGSYVMPQGSGRTDAGVHARAQIASFELVEPIPPPNLLRALNRTLPSPIRVLAAEHVDPDFHARHSVRAKTYEYRIYRGEICPPWLTRYVYALNWPLDAEQMQRAAALVVGEHDFTSFAATDPDLSSRHAGRTPRTTTSGPSFHRRGMKARTCSFTRSVGTAFFTTWFATWWEPSSMPGEAISRPTRLRQSCNGAHGRLRELPRQPEDCFWIALNIEPQYAKEEDTANLSRLPRVSCG